MIKLYQVGFFVGFASWLYVIVSLILLVIELHIELLLEYVTIGDYNTILVNICSNLEYFNSYNLHFIILIELFGFMLILFSSMSSYDDYEEENKMRFKK